MAVNPVPNDIPIQPKIINEFMLSQKKKTNKIWETHITKFKIKGIILYKYYIKPILYYKGLPI